MSSIYLDHAATTPTDPRVSEAMRPYFGEIFGNPASLHAFGQEAAAAVAKARATIAAFIGAAPAEVVFTGGGTEGDNLAIKGVAWANRQRGDHIVTTAIEHKAILESCRFLRDEGFQVTLLPVDGEGLVDPDDVIRAITPRTVLVSVMQANNEIGTIQPLAEIGRRVRERGVLFHTDAVQTFGHLPISVDDLGVDLLSASAHKLYGPKGVGLLYIRRGTRIAPLLSGGEQEEGRRASTLNVPGIVGFAAATALAAASLEDEAARLTALRDRFIAGLFAAIDGIRLNGHPARRLPNNVHVSVDGADGEGLLLSLDLLGIACSTGSACSATAVEASHVLKAIAPPRGPAGGSLRFSLGRDTREQEIDAVVATLPQVVRRLRALT